MNQELSYAVCCIPVSPLRLEPSHRSEMVSQQLFGESCAIIERGKDHWIKVKTRYDDYEGWCQDGHVTPVDEKYYNTDTIALTAEWINEIEYNGKKMIVPFGSTLITAGDGETFWKDNTVRYHGKRWNTKAITRNEKTIREIAFRFLNTSYLWGGKSIFGIDCSGFSQTVYKFLQQPLPRDAYQQATVGDAIGFLQESRCGDLAFFDNPEGRITHVGILLNEHEIIHSSVKVRIDKIDNEGIINQDTFERTHRLRIIRRYF